MQHHRVLMMRVLTVLEARGVCCYVASGRQGEGLTPGNHSNALVLYPFN